MRPSSASTEAASFNPFLVRASVYCDGSVHFPRGRFRGQFQSLLSQGISLLTFLFSMPGISTARLFQSLLSQGISLLRFSEALPADLLGGFNPFLVRASVYWRADRPSRG